MGVLANAGEDIEHLASAGRGVKRAIGGQQGKLKLAGELNEDIVRLLLAAPMMALDFDEKIFAPENIEQRFENFRRSTAGRCMQGGDQRAIDIARQGDKARGKFRQFVPAHCAFIFFGAKMSSGEKAAEILITGTILDENGKNAARFHRELGADDGAKAKLPGLIEKPGGAVNAIAIAKRESRHLENSRRLDEIFGQRSSTQKTEGAAAMKFDVGHDTDQVKSSADCADDRRFL
jgi:hypothetical protein